MSKRAFFFGLFVIAVLIFSLYRAKYGARESAEQIAAIEAQIEQAEAEQRDLRAEFSHRSRQEWIEEYARKELGMVPQKAEQFVRSVELDGRVGPPVQQREPSRQTDREGRDD